MLGNMFNKKMMEKMQGQMGEIKTKLDNISVTGESKDGQIKVIANGNRMLESISITEDLHKDLSKEELVELILIAANRSLEQAERVEKSEMSHAAMGMLPGLGS